MADRRVQRMAERLGLTPLLDRPVEQLSAGERGRVALGRALVRRPAVCLLDEPLANLDPPQRRALAADLKRWQRQLGVSMLCVTHDPAEALALADRVAVLERGRLEQLAPPQDIYERPATRWAAEMLGRPAMNLIAGRLTAAGFELERSAEQGLLCPADRFAKLPAHETQVAGVLLGVRATDVAVLAATNGSPENSTAPAGVLMLAGRVVSLELVDGRRWATVVVAGQSVVGLVSESLAGQLTSGQPAMLQIETTRCVWFDVGTGRRLGP